MSHVKEYIEKSLLIPPDAKESLLKEEVHEVLRDDIVSFIETYTSLEQAIMHEVNQELAILNLQVRKHLEMKEAELHAQEIRGMEQEMAYL